MVKKKFATDKKVLVRKAVFIDGITRAGKFLLGKLLAGLDGLEYFQYTAALEYVPYVMRLGGMTTDAAMAILHSVVDEYSYNMRVGRNLNFRTDDASSVANSLDEERYLARMKRPMNKDFAEEIARFDRIPVFILHETLPFIDLFMRTFSGGKWIEAERHPVDLIYSWNARGWGTKYSDDPMYYSPILESPHAPWFAAEWQDEYPGMSPVDRIIKSIASVMEMGQKSYRTLPEDWKKNVLFVSYESLVENTRMEIDKIASFLAAEKSPRLDRILERENLPLKSVATEREKKIATIRKTASRESFDLMMDLARKYEARDKERRK